MLNTNPGDVDARTGRAVALRALDWIADQHDFADTAALIQALDLVITVDTSVAHAAGALGRPVLGTEPLRPLLAMDDRTDTLWYPTMRLFTQTRPGAWDM